MSERERESVCMSLREISRRRERDTHTHSCPKQERTYAKTLSHVQPRSPNFQSQQHYSQDHLATSRREGYLGHPYHRLRQTFCLTTWQQQAWLQAGRGLLVGTVGPLGRLETLPSCTGHHQTRPCLPQATAQRTERKQRSNQLIIRGRTWRT